MPSHQVRTGLPWKTAGRKFIAVFGVVGLNQMTLPSFEDQDAALPGPGRRARKR